jgi:hypothetical protein
MGGADTMSAFYVIDTEAEKVGKMNIFGPYETRAGAEAFIRMDASCPCVKDFADWWEESDTPLKDRDAASSATYQILQLVAEVRPVGSSSLKVKLVEEAK